MRGRNGDARTHKKIINIRQKLRILRIESMNPKHLKLIEVQSLFLFPVHKGFPHERSNTYQ